MHADLCVYWVIKQLWERNFKSPFMCKNQSLEKWPCWLGDFGSWNLVLRAHLGPLFLCYNESKNMLQWHWMMWVVSGCTWGRIHVPILLLSLFQNTGSFYSPASVCEWVIFEGFYGNFCIFFHAVYTKALSFKHMTSGTQFPYGHDVAHMLILELHFSMLAKG